MMMLLAYGLFAVDFDAFFEPQTLRVDYFHAGTATEEHFALDRMVYDGPWAGSRTQLIDELEFGKYLVKLWDQNKQQLLYSEGFATIYGEWETTGPAKRGWGVFHESVRVPRPKGPAQLELLKRDAENRFQTVWELLIDPADRRMTKRERVPEFKAWDIYAHGDPATKVDLLILGDGYAASEMEKFHADARRMADYLFTEEPFKSRKTDFNVRAIDTPSGESGVSRPHDGVFRRPALTTHYSSFDSQRYVLCYDNRRLREIASAVPYEYMVILVNEVTYGGGGIYRWQATAAVDSGYSRYLFVHEFGHHFAALADEYYTSSIAYELGDEVTVEPWEANLTALLDAKALKWADLVEETTPLPTPWEKEAFDKASLAAQEQRAELRKKGVDETVIDRLFDKQKKHDTELLSGMTYSGKVGAFEGAGYRAKGYYRPSADCIMFTRDEVGFCPVCRRTINKVIDRYTR